MGLFQGLSDLAITAIQQITDDVEEEFSDDCSGYGSVIGEMQWEHNLDEEQIFVATTYFTHCDTLRWLSLVRTGEHKEWVPVRLSDESVRAKSLVPRNDQRECLNSSVKEKTFGVSRLVHDPEGFVQLFPFARQAAYHDECWDPHDYWHAHDQVFKDKVRECLWGVICC